MYDDLEADFWKNVIVKLQQKNMRKTDGKKLTVENCKEEFLRFNNIHPEIKVETTFTDTYVIWEFFITRTIKVRLYIQNQLKIIFLQKDKGELVKICDAKIPYNPFSEIYELINDKDLYEVEIEKLKSINLRNERKMKLAFQFVKSYLSVKIGENSKITWNIQITNDSFDIVFNDENKEFRLMVTPENFKEKIDLYLKDKNIA